MNSGYRRTQITTLSQKKTYIQGIYICIFYIQSSNLCVSVYMFDNNS